MRLKTLLVTSTVTLALTAAMGSAQADDKVGANGRQGGRAAVPADQAVAVAAVAVSPAVAQASSSVQARIVDFVQANGTKYTFGAYADRKINKVVVQTDAPSDVVASLVRSFEGQVEVRKEAISEDFSRRDDVPAFWGGAGVTPTAGTGWCSDGYTVQNSAGTRFMVTAGHCFTDGQTALTELGGRVVGTVSGRGLPTHDMELIGGQSYAPFIYTGGVDSSTGAHIASAGDPVVGFNNYCTSGRTTGENCGHTDLDNNATVCTSSGCKSPVIAYNGGNLPQGGDSGAPFYVGSVGAPDMHIRGHHIAGGGGTSYAELYSRVAGRFGVTIVT